MYLELGILPIEFNIHINQLQFLYHILSLEDEDPVKENYEQQKLYLFEKNWFNEVSALRSKYDIGHTDEEIISMSKEKWKSVVHSNVRAFALNHLNAENLCKSKTSNLPAYSSLIPQSYFEFLRPADARLFFAMRSGTLDIKTMRRYNYEDGDVLCRLCGKDEETLGHIVNNCQFVSRSYHMEDILSVVKEDVVEVVSRVKQFNHLVEEIQNS